MANTLTRHEEKRISQDVGQDKFHTTLALFSLAMAIFTAISTSKTAQAELKRR